MATFWRACLQLLVWLALGIASANATIIDFTATQLSVQHWRYDYAIHNDTLGMPIKEFTIFFGEDAYANLSSVSSLAQWDLILIQPDAAIPAAGYFDGLGLSASIAANATLTGLSVSFDYSGTGSPGAQLFSIIDPVSFTEVEMGLTTHAAVALPLPDSLSLIVIGLLSVAIVVRRPRGEK